MGSNLSLLNDTDDVIMVKVTLNTAVLPRIGVDIAAGIQSAYRTVQENNTCQDYTPQATTVEEADETSLISSYEKEGFVKVVPGTKWTQDRAVLSKDQRMWLVRLGRGDTGRVSTIRTANSSVLAGRTKNSMSVYEASETKHFRWQ